MILLILVLCVFSGDAVAKDSQLISDMKVNSSNGKTYSHECLNLYKTCSGFDDECCENLICKYYYHGSYCECGNGFKEDSDGRRCIPGDPLEWNLLTKVLVGASGSCLALVFLAALYRRCHKKVPSEEVTVVFHQDVPPPPEMTAVMRLVQLRLVQISPQEPPPSPPPRYEFPPSYLEVMQRRT